MTTVAVCGVSLLFSVVASQLAAVPALNVITIDPNRPDVALQIAAAHPDVALIERGGSEPPATGADCLLLAVLRACPNLPVVRLETGGGEVTVLTSRALAINRLDDLVHWVAEMGNGEKVPAGRMGWRDA